MTSLLGVVAGASSVAKGPNKSKIMALIWPKENLSEPNLHLLFLLKRKTQTEETQV